MLPYGAATQPWSSASTASIDRFAPLTSRTLIPAPPAATLAAGELDQAIQRGHGVRQVRLEHDSRLESVELGLGEQRHEHLEGQVEVAVLLHVEVDERVRLLVIAARYSGRSRPSTRATVAAVSHVEIWETRADTLIET